jgi:hypothetical protein
MDQRAIVKCESRLRNCRKHLEELYLAKNYEEFSDVWYNFLTSAKNIYTILEQGAKTRPDSIKWHKNISDDRRADELLKYIYEARNDEEHGLSEVLSVQPPQTLIGIAQPGFSDSIRIDGSSETGFRITNLGTGPVLSDFRPERGKLNSVTNRKGAQISPPTVHLGQPIPEVTPEAVAGLALEYLEKLVAEATALSKLP